MTTTTHESIDVNKNTIKMRRTYGKGKGNCTVKINAIDTVPSDDLLTVFYLMDNLEKSFPDAEIAIEVGFNE